MNHLIKMMMFFMFVLAGCGGESREEAARNIIPAETSSQVNMEKITEGEYNSLSVEQKYALSNRLMSALYKGVPARAFFDLSKGMGAPSLKSEENYVSSVEAALAKPLVDKEVYLQKINDRYSFDSSMKSKQYPLAMLFEYPVSKELFDGWMTYRLANTILFSPAEELDSTDYTDIQRVFDRLMEMIGKDSSIEEIVYTHMNSQENWRRFRSPEDNTREMLEIYLKKYMDEDVPKAAVACKNWYLSDKSQGYQLMRSVNQNTKSMELLDTIITTCDDFYAAVSKHSSLVPAVVSTIVDHFFASYDANRKKAITDQIVATNPTTFRQVFKTILFSREYLISNERPKTFEEAFFNIAANVDWYANSSFFQDLNKPSTVFSPIERLSDMKQDSMSYKLGRLAAVPLDSLSFSYYHRSIRSRLLTDRKVDQLNTGDGGWQTAFIDVPLKGDDFIQYLFLSTLSRKASPREISIINGVLVSQGHDNENNKMEQAVVILDYVSRLSELYAFSAVK